MLRPVVMCTRSMEVAMTSRLCLTVPLSPFRMSDRGTSNLVDEAWKEEWSKGEWERTGRCQRHSFDGLLESDSELNVAASKITRIFERTEWGGWKG